MFTNKEDLSHFLPLSKNFIYAPEIGLALRIKRSDWWNSWIDERRRKRYMFSNALGFAFLKYLENNVSEEELLKATAFALQDSGSRIRLALEYRGDNNPQNDFPYTKEASFPEHQPLIALAHTPSYAKAIDTVYKEKDHFLIARATELSKESILENTSCLALGLEKNQEALKEGFASYYIPFHSGLVEKEKGRDGGLFNILSIIALQSLKRENKRIAILNISKRHHIGTQDIFYQKSEVFTASVHDPLPSYTGTGGEENTGLGRGEGFNENIEWNDKAQLSKRLFSFKPEMVYLRIDNTLPQFHKKTRQLLKQLAAPVLVEASDKKTFQEWTTF